MLVEELSQAIRKSDPEAYEAALALGLLIEREKVRRPAGDDGGVEQILGAELASHRLSSTELQIAVDELIAYINNAQYPHPTAVWALTKSYEPRILPHLISLLERVVNAPNYEHLTYQALIGIINVGVSSSYRKLSLAAIRKAAEQGHGEVKETATSYLDTILEGDT